jgi:isocitrate dehydrogenase kinase/phosphatase
MDSNRLVPLVVTLIHAAFDSHQVLFSTVTRRARERFERREWHEAQQDAAFRLALYKQHIAEVLAEVRAFLGDETTNPALWAKAKGEYARLVGERDDVELAETFFNSVVRRIFSTVGVDPGVEFVVVGRTASGRAEDRICRTYRAPSRDASTAALVRRLLLDCCWEVPYVDVDRDASLVAAAVDEAGARNWGAADGDGLATIDMLAAPFFRNKGAYLVGRVRRGPGEATFPLVLPLLNEERGIRVDAALTTSDEASVVFGFSWSYFHVDAPRPRAVVEFLRSIMPHKRVDELYNSIGYNKHGKTELYRSLLEHLEAPDAQFEHAEGEEGLVMSVFTLPSFNVVFKIIKDTFGLGKKTTRRTVMEKYQLVFVLDRVGRLADAQEFEHLAFRRDCFAEPLLADLLKQCGRTVHVDGDRVVVSHLYTERRVTPLNLFLRESPEEAARDAVLDYGSAIKDLAAANIFAGDMLLKNFGVTRHGRVIFYDYDELVLLSECNFREIPRAPDLNEEMSAEPWFYVGDDDVFPEEFSAFMSPPTRLCDAFLAQHSDLFEIAFWRRMQARHRAGELVDVFPYRRSRRFPRE